MNLYEAITDNKTSAQTQSDLRAINDCLTAIKARPNPKKPGQLSIIETTCILVYAGNVNYCLSSSEYNTFKDLAEKAMNSLVTSLSPGETTSKVSSCVFGGGF